MLTATLLLALAAVGGAIGGWRLLRRPKPVGADPFLAPWRAYAAARGLELVGGGPARIHGFARGIAIEIDTFRADWIDEERPPVFVRVHGRPRKPLAHRVRVEPLLWPKEGTVTTGDREFDARFVIEADDQGAARGLLDEEVRQLLVRFPALGVSLSCDLGSVQVHWPAAAWLERADPAVMEVALDTALKLVVAACLPAPERLGPYRT